MDTTKQKKNLNANTDVGKMAKILVDKLPAKCSIGEKNPKCWSWFQEVSNDDER